MSGRCCSGNASPGRPVRTAPIPATTPPPAACSIASSGPTTAPDPRRRAARRGVIGVLAGALIMLIAATALAATGQAPGVLGVADQQPSASGGSAVEDADERPALTTEPGRCLTWGRDDAGDVREVDCAQPHLFESVGAVTATQPPGAPFPPTRPGSSSSPTSAPRRPPGTCRAASTPRAATRRARSSRPRPRGTAATARCAAGCRPRAARARCFPSTGRVADADQAVVFDAGTCLGLAGKEVSDPVACGETHAAEVAGVVDLGTQFRDAFPSVDDQDNYLQPTCQRIAEQYVGSAQKLTDSKLTVYWTNLAQESWTAGTRRVTCNLGSLLTDNSRLRPAHRQGRGRRHDRRPGRPATRAEPASRRAGVGAGLRDARPRGRRHRDRWRGRRGGAGEPAGSSSSPACRCRPCPSRASAAADPRTVEVPPDRFEELVADALDELPAGPDRGDGQRRRARRRPPSRGTRPARALRGRRAHRALQRLRRRAARPDHALPPCRRATSATTRTSCARRSR